MGLGERIMPGSVVGCAENVIDVMVVVFFVRLHFFA